MSYPTLTAAYAAVLALIYVVLSGWVIAGRARYRINHGDGGNEAMARRIRVHANFVEYVPLILLLVGLLEAHGANRIMIHILLLVLVVARVMHPIGMLAPEIGLRQFLFRGTSTVATFAVMTIAAVTLLVRIVL